MEDTDTAPPDFFDSFFLIAGPCVLEGSALHEEIAEVLLQIRQELLIPVIFKGSFDKANRSRGDAPRGPLISNGLDYLAQVRELCELPVLTDIHEPWQAQEAAEVCDVLQVPAALCRQTNLITAAAQTGRAVVLKKGQWVGVSEMEGAVGKVRAVASSPPVAVTERGTFFGYGDLVVDMRNIVKLQQSCHVPVIFDACHVVQRPAQGLRGASAGDSLYIAPLARAAVASGANGLYLEVHPKPLEAPSDGASMLPLDQLLYLMREVMAIREALSFDTLYLGRKEVS